MNCPLGSEETRDLLIDYSAGRLDTAAAAALDRHVENCADCGAFLREQAAVWNALDAWEPAPVSIDFNRRLWLRIDDAANAPWYRLLADSLRFANWKPAFPLALAVLAIAGGFLLDHQRRNAPASPATVQGVSFTEADQLEQTLDDIQLLRQLDSVTPQNGSSKRM